MPDHTDLPVHREVLELLQRHFPANADGTMNVDNVAGMIALLVTLTAGAIVCSFPHNPAMREALFAATHDQLRRLSQVPAPPSMGARRGH